MHTRRVPRGTSIATIALSVLLISGCSATDHDAGTTAPAAASSGDSTVPEFDGPYAAEFTETYARAQNDFIRTALEDEVVSDAEYAEMTERFRSCLADAGITFNGFQPDGGFSTTIAPGGLDTHAIINDCSGPSGQDTIGLLHDIMAGNPDNIDAAVAIAACLVETGDFPASYTDEDYRKDREGRFRDTEALDPELAEVLDACMTDPFDATGSR